jgi:hypothetical protein
MPYAPSGSNRNKDRYMMAVQKVTSGELLTKQAMRKKIYYIQKICICLSYFSA